MKADEPVNLAHFRDITLGDEDVAADIISLFSENIGVYLEALSQSRGEQESAWQDTAHKIKGVARSIGAFRLASIAERAETVTALDERHLILLEIENEKECVLTALQNIK